MTQLNMTEVAKRLDGANIPLTIADARHSDMPLCYVNPAFCSTTGYATDQVIGKNCRFLQGDLENDTARLKMRRGLAQKTGLQVIFRNKRADGSIFDNLVIIEPLTDHDGELLYVVGSQFVLKDGIKTDHAATAGEGIVREIDKLLQLNERLRATSRQALARSMAASVKLWLER
ncbi:PAS domain-containing protein [Loktanella salsilacus]|uniref:PAS domain-containing protein n=1 Tax=Loktanella salsilacus TaxID=195913 RepID=UPI00373599F0